MMKRLCIIQDASYIANPWLKPEEHQSNFLTGREMIIADKMPMIVHEASATNKLQQLFDIIGKSIPEDIYKFHNRESYEHLLNELAEDKGKKFISNMFIVMM